MPLYYFRLRSADAAHSTAQRHDFPDLSAALAEAQHAARRLIGNRLRSLGSRPSGSLDIEDEMREPIARIMLADVAQQSS